MASLYSRGRLGSPIEQSSQYFVIILDMLR